MFLGIKEQVTKKFKGIKRTNKEESNGRKRLKRKAEM